MNHRSKPLAFINGVVALFLLLFCFTQLHLEALADTNPVDLAVLNALAAGVSNPPPDWASGDPCGVPGWSHVQCRGPRVIGLQLQGAGLRGTLPPTLSTLAALQGVALQGNFFTGALPSLSGLSQLKTALLNDRQPASAVPPGGEQPSRRRRASLRIAPLPSLRTLWLQVNNFSGRIPAALSSAISLEEIRLNDNNLVGPIPAAFAASSSLRFLSVQNNLLTGTIPLIPSINTPQNYTFASGNHFCLPQPTSAACAPPVAALLSFLDGVNYPVNLLPSWTGNNPCPWQGIACDTAEVVTAVNLPRAQLTGTISPELAKITSLVRIVLAGNSLTGTIPASLTSLTSLVLLDVSSNNLSGPVPPFDLGRVALNVTGNPALIPP